MDWCHVILKTMYKDIHGFKYAQVASLNRELQSFTHAKLYTFGALQQWLDTKPALKKLLLEQSIESGQLCGIEHKT